MNAREALVSFAIASYAKSPEPEPGTVLIRDRKIIARGTATKAAKAPKAPKAERPIAQPVETTVPKAEPNLKLAAPLLPQPGTVDGKGFMVLIRRAKSRQEQIAAVSAYIGYTLSLDLAAQIFNATQRAKSELSPIDPGKVVSRAEKASLAATVRGYVAGMPDGERKLMQDLMGRERLAVDTRNELERAANEPDCTPAQKEMLLAQAELEVERLAHIRAELAQRLG